MALQLPAHFAPFGQDNPHNKINLLIAKIDMILPTIEMAALEGKQVQPVIIENVI